MEIASQIASTVGAVLILVGYLGLQTKRLKEVSFVYLNLNFWGGALLLFAAIVTGQAGFILFCSGLIRGALFSG